jgi:hypothetical protein
MQDANLDRWLLRLADEAEGQSGRGKQRGDEYPS